LSRHADPLADGPPVANHPGGDRWWDSPIRPM